MTTPSSRAGSLFALVVFSMTILAIVAVVAFYTTSRPSSSSPHTLSVTGTASASGTPDTASFTMGASTIAATASAALTKNNSEVASLEAALLAHGVAKSDMQTSNLSVYPVTNQQGTITGFSVNDSLNVTMHDMAKVGTAVDAAASAVGNDVTLSGISFSISNDSSLLAAARTKAIAASKTMATQLAGASNVALGAVTKIVDQENQATPIIYPSNTFAAAGSSVPVQAGKQDVTVTVSVDYAIS